MYNFAFTFTCASVQIYDLPRCCVGGNDNTGDEDAKGHSKSKAKNKRRRPGYGINLSWQLHAIFLNLFYKQNYHAAKLMCHATSAHI
jgi:hypothetical protein